MFPRSGGTGKHPGGFSVSPEKEIPKALWAACSSALLFHAQSKEVLCHVQMEIPVYELVPVPHWAPLKRSWSHPLMRNVLKIKNFQSGNDLWEGHFIQYCNGGRTPPSDKGEIAHQSVKAIMLYTLGPMQVKPLLALTD